MSTLQKFKHAGTVPFVDCQQSIIWGTLQVTRLGCRLPSTLRMTSLAIGTRTGAPSRTYHGRRWPDVLNWPL